MRVVKRQIELQRAKEAKLKKRAKVKTESGIFPLPPSLLPLSSRVHSSLSYQLAGVLLCGDLIEKISFSDTPQAKVLLPYTKISFKFYLFVFLDLVRRLGRQNGLNYNS
jgi:hypothetical protein